jgi:ssDNA-binding Zn-finger/Zn-ribbon topoisomerase 1
MPDRETKGGHPSGDTPVSELLVPDVLMWPALGMAPPEPQDAAPRVPNLPCPKCGEPDTTMRWCAGGYSLAHGMCVETVDHFHRGCPRCAYRWTSFDILDGGKMDDA